MTPADGFSINYGNAPLGDQGQAEEGMAGRPGVTENISFEVDTWRNGDARARCEYFWFSRRSRRWSACLH